VVSALGCHTPGLFSKEHQCAYVSDCSFSRKGPGPDRVSYMHGCPREQSGGSKNALLIGASDSGNPGRQMSAAFWYITLEQERSSRRQEQLQVKRTQANLKPKG
jgi:hypothetical protein